MPKEYTPSALPLAADQIEQIRQSSLRNTALLLVALIITTILLGTVFDPHLTLTPPSVSILRHDHPLDVRDIFFLTLFFITIQGIILWRRERIVCTLLTRITADLQHERSEKKRVTQELFQFQQEQVPLAEQGRKAEQIVHQAEAKMYQMEERLHQLADMADLFLLVCDDQQQILWASRSAHNRLGIDPGSRLGAVGSPAIQMEPAQSYAELWEKSRRRKQISEPTARISGIRGEGFACSLKMAHIAGEDHHAGGEYFLSLSYLDRRGDLFLKDKLQLVYGGPKGFLEATGTLNAILQDQLRKVLQETEEASYNLTRQIQQVDRNIGEIMDFLTHTSAAGQASGSQSQKDLFEDRQAIQEIELFVQGVRARKEAERMRGQQVIDEINGLRQFVDMVHDISERTNVLSLNARIIASKSAGQEGRQFAEVAGEVRKLSQQVRQAAQEIGNGIAQSVTAIDALFSHNQGGEESTQHTLEEETLLNQMAGKMVRMGEHYATLLDHNESILNRITEWNKGLSNDVMDLLANFQFQDITRQQMEHVIRALTKHKEYALSLSNLLANHAIDATNFSAFHVDDLFHDYVMEGQREIHSNNTGVQYQAAESRPKIELF